MGEIAGWQDGEDSRRADGWEGGRMATDEDLVLTEVDADGVATFTLNRPERRNAWTAPMENRYFDVLAAADADPAVRVGVLTGAGTSFCPGMDMSRLAEVAGRPVNISARPPQYAPPV